MAPPPEVLDHSGGSLMWVARFARLEDPHVLSVCLVRVVRSLLEQGDVGARGVARRSKRVGAITARADGGNLVATDGSAPSR